jgi:hypothetical protein
MNQKNGFGTTAVAYVNASNGVKSEQGFLRCTSMFTTGSAKLVGDASQKTFTEFEYSNLLTTSNTTKLSLMPPMFAALYEISQTFLDKTSANKERAMSVIRMLGYEKSHDASDSSPNRYEQPSLEQMAKSLWSGAAHMGAAINILGSKPQLTMVSQPVHVSGRTKHFRWVIVAAALLFVWLAMLIFCTARMFRRTFGGSLSSYPTSRLLVDLPFLVDGHCAGQLADNPNLRAGFLRVGDLNPDEDIGHISSGGTGVLDVKRQYGARFNGDPDPRRRTLLESFV